MKRTHMPTMAKYPAMAKTIVTVQPPWADNNVHKNSQSWNGGPAFRRFPDPDLNLARFVSSHEVCLQIKRIESANFELVCAV